MRESLLALTTTVTALLVQARALAEPVEVAATRLLDAHEAAERGKLRIPAPEPDRTELDRAIAVARARVEEIDALDDRIRALTARIGPLVTARRARRPSLLSRWYRATFDDDLLDRLKAERERLQRERLLVEVPMRIALKHKHRAEEAHALAVAAAGSAHDREVEKTRTRLAAIARARRLLRHWPAFAFAGVRWLIGSGGRVNRAKARGWDPDRATFPVSASICPQVTG